MTARRIAERAAAEVFGNALLAIDTEAGRGPDRLADHYVIVTVVQPSSFDDQWNQEGVFNRRLRELDAPEFGLSIMLRFTARGS
jgi:hypothetical protein